MNQNNSHAPSWGEYLRDKVSLVGYIQRYETLTDIHGGEWQGAHSVKHTSEGGKCLNVNEEKGLWHCYHCPSKGDVISYEIDRTGVDFQTACRAIADTEGLSLPETEVTAEEQERQHKAQVARKQITGLLNDAARFYHSQLTPEFRKYYLGRGISNATIDELLLGWAGKDKRALLKHLYQRHKDRELLLATGLFYEKDSKLYDAFTERYIFPYFRSTMEVCYFIGRDATGGRTYTDRKTGEPKRRAKYKKLRKTETAAVEHVLWGAHEVGREKPILILEGIVDAILARQALPEYDVVSPVTTRINRTDIDKLADLLIKHNGRDVIICNDAEVSKAGSKGALDTATKLEKAVHECLSKAFQKRLVDGKDEQVSDEHQRSDWIQMRMPRLRIATLQKPPELKKIDVADYIEAGRVNDLRYWIQASRDIERYKYYLRSDPLRFFDGKTFIVKELTDEMRFEGRYYIDVGRTLHAYEDGVYLPAEASVQKLAAEKLIRFRNENRTEAAVKDLQVIRHFDVEAVNSKHILNCRNGILDLNTHQLTSHSPHALSTVKVPINYNPQADCPKFNAFLEEIVPEECVKLVYEMIGYCLHNTAELHKAFILLGEGRNGKSTLLMAITRLLGTQNVSSIPLQMLEDDRFAAADLYGKLANIYADIPDTPLRKCDMFNCIVTGDKIRVQQKYERAFEFIPSTTQIFSCNKIPASYTHTEGYFRRLLMIPFPNSFDGKRSQSEILAEIASPAELEGVLITALSVFMGVRDRGAFSVPEVSQKALADYKQINEPALRFLSEHVVADQGDIKRSSLYSAYKKWLEAAEPSRKPLSDRKFYTFVRKMFPNVKEGQTRHQGRRSRSFDGIHLSDNFREDFPDDSPQQAFEVQ